MTIPPELKEAEVSCEWIFRVMLKDARKLPSRTWLTPDDVASFLETKRKELQDFCDELRTSNQLWVQPEDETLGQIQHKIDAVLQGSEKNGCS